MGLRSGGRASCGARAGRERVWELEPARLAEARRWLEASSRWDAAIGRLRAIVERP